MWLTPSVKSCNNLENSDLENSDLKKSDLETPYLEKSDLKTSYMYLKNSDLENLDVNFSFEGKFCSFKSVLVCLFQFVKEL